MMHCPLNSLPYLNLSILIFDPESAREEIWRSLEMVEFFDLDKVVEYAIFLGNATTAAKVGFFLEQHANTLVPNEDHIEYLRSRKPVKPHYMVHNGRKGDRFIREWNLIMPPEIVERQWEEML